MTSNPAAPDAVETAERAASLAAAYVHVPFCARVCPYCDFNVIAGRGDLVDRYVAAVATEVNAASPWRALDAVYVGGGTPTRVQAGLLEHILDALERRFGFGDGAEISIEANPEDWSAATGKALRDAGFTRISFGVQSFSPRVLEALGRVHTGEQAEIAIGQAMELGFVVNVDLIFGTPGETIDEWEETVRRSVSLEPDHLSVYALTVERGTALGRAVADGAPAPDEDLQAEEYELAGRCSGDLVRYEVSNFARPGRACLYNLVTWAQGEYLAFGAGAHGHRSGERFRNVRRVDAYVGRIESGTSPVQGSERLDPWGREQERLLLGLRRTAGVRGGEAGDRLLDSSWGHRLREADVIAAEGGRIFVRQPLLTDEVSRAVLALSG